MAWKMSVVGLMGLCSVAVSAPAPAEAFLNDLKRLTKCPPDATSPGCTNQKKQKQRAAPTQAQIALREERRAVQAALNSFAFDAGTPDGIMGPRSRSAIAAYQGVIGAEATGQLTPEQQQLLLQTEAQMNAGTLPAQAAIMVQAGPQGLLRAAVDPVYAAQFMPAQPNAQAAGLAPLPSLAPAAPSAQLAPLPTLAPSTPDTTDTGQLAPLPALAPSPSASASTTALTPLPTLAPAEGEATTAPAPLPALPTLTPATN